MRFDKKFLFVITVFFLLLAVFAGKEEQEPDGFLSVDVTYDDRMENIAYWESHDVYYLYLPGNADVGQMQLRFSEGASWKLNGMPLTDRMPCELFDLNTDYELTNHGEHVGTVRFLQSANVGAMFLDTASGDMEHIHAVKGNKESGTLRLYSQTGVLNHDGILSGINGRGNSTWKEEKKSYSLELAVEADLLDMGSAKKWILLSNIYDGTNLHNKVVYDFAQDFGLAYSPDSDWVDLYLNGEYAGLYLLSERNEVHPQRVDLSQTDSFLVSRDAYWRFEEQGKPYITTESRAALRIYHAGMTQEEMLAIWQSAENAILRDDGIDPVTGKSWQELIDVESWVKKYLIDEVFGNMDGTALSQFYYYDSSGGNGKIFAGPVWDYDLSMRYDSENQQESVQQFFANVPEVYGSLWPDALYRKPEYFDRIIRLYETEVLPLLDVYMQTTIPQYADRIAAASVMNASRWGLWNADKQNAAIQEYLSLRTAFLNDIWLEKSEYCMINAKDENETRHYYAVKPGSVLPSQLRYESSDSHYRYTWYDSVTGDPVPVDEPIYTDVTIHVRYESIAPAKEEEMVPFVEEPGEAEVWQEQEKSDAAVVLPPLQRLLPLLLLAGMFVLVCLVGICRDIQERKR